MPNPVASRSDRRDAIVRILQSHPAATQQSIVRMLRESGFLATQSSVSRDLRELGAVKTAEGYRLPQAGDGGADEFEQVRNLLDRLKTAGPNLVVIRTAVGGAQRVALALDRSRWPEIVGTVGGDDTVFVATTDHNAQRRLVARLERVIRHA